MDRYEKIADELEKKLQNENIEEKNIKVIKNNIKLLRLPGNNQNKDRIIEMISRDIKELQYDVDYKLLSKYIMTCDNLEDEKRISLLKKVVLLRDDSFSYEKKDIISRELFLFKIRHSNFLLIEQIKDMLRSNTSLDDDYRNLVTSFIDDALNSQELEKVNNAITFLENIVPESHHTKSKIKHNC